MKEFIRRLSINERKGFMHCIIYSVFCGIHILLSRIILKKSHIHYLTLLSLSGSLLILMSFYRIFRSLNKIRAMKDKDNLERFNFFEGIFSFLSYGGLLASLNFTSLTNVVLITRLFPYIAMFKNLISESNSIPSYYLYCFLAYLFCFCIIFIPLIGSDQAPGIFLCLISIIFKLISNKKGRRHKGIKIDLTISTIGFYSALFGGILMVITYNKMEHISKLLWCLIILNTFTTYIMKIFLNKLIKNNLNFQKLLLLNLVILIIAFPIDLTIFKEKFSLLYSVLALFSMDIFFFYNKEVKPKVIDNNNDK